MPNCTHDFGKAWPFPDPVNRVAFSTVHVTQEGFPILLVTHDDDGAWQVLCGTTNDPKQGVAMCLGCMFQLDPSIGEVADLPPGWVAWRAAAGEPWQREPHGPEES